MYGSILLVGVIPPIVSAFASTGMTAPVFRTNSRCPKTFSSYQHVKPVAELFTIVVLDNLLLKIEVIVPEWLVIDIYVLES